MSYIASPARTGLLADLNREWLQRYAEAPTRTTDGTPWATSHPALHPFETTGQIIDFLASRPSRRDADAVLHALLTLTRQGDACASRTVVQTMLGVCQRHARTVRNRGLGDCIATAVEAMCTAVSEYPLHRRDRVAANLAMEALHRLPARPVLQEQSLGHEVLEAQVHQDQETGRLVAEMECTEEDAARVILWGLDHEVLSPDEARLLTEVHLEHTTLAALAARCNVGAPTIRQRHARAVRRLASELVRALNAPTLAEVRDEFTRRPERIAA